MREVESRAISPALADERDFTPILVAATVSRQRQIG
jgi:hypothetical protein